MTHSSGTGIDRAYVDQMHDFHVQALVDHISLRNASATCLHKLLLSYNGRGTRFILQISLIF